ncbi:reticulocyte-binding protein homolog 2a-like isoform X2 [Euwallacea fornicatus]|uniref:reticulocyte-binding protein homolog 2a-like isoform X2 n=1 Tax=Euwallacea fornicatus TaxID=995702 RepID=UPI00338EC33C
MLISEEVQTGIELRKKELEERIMRDGLELLRKQKEEARRRKIKEQQEMKEMLERYWPWSKPSDAIPRGLRNLRLEEIFPDKDYQDAKRFVGSLDLGRPGCGAPNIKDGQRMTKTKEDPLLRFQLGSKDLKKAVENSFRYKTNKEEQMQYKRELDKLVEEKKQRQLKQKFLDVESEKRQFLKTPPWGLRGPGGWPWRQPQTVGLGFLASLGWSNEETLRKLEQETILKKCEDDRYQNFRKSKMVPPNRVVKLDPISETSKKEFVVPGKARKLSPLSGNKENGLELVDLLAKDRRTSIKVPLSSTDVTKEKKNGICSRSGSSYLKDLTAQMLNKREQIQEMKRRDNETSMKHFSTWESFWGKPGNGAPGNTTKKGSIERLLYPQRIPIGVA